jgi:uncharacterized protein (TIGR02145 family)
MKQLFDRTITNRLRIILLITCVSCNDNNEPSTSMAEITTSEITEITQQTAKSGGNITSDGGASVTTRGVCWSVNPSPTVDNNKTIDGSGGGNFTSTVTGLSPNTKYYLRAYATNSNGTAYGISFSFTTTEAIIPDLTTSAITDITETSAKSGGLITATGGSDIITRGVCWSTEPTPTIANSKTNDGSGTGSYISSINGLTSGTTYYLRAYATNQVGTNYGDELSFRTQSIPEIGTTEIFNITHNSASSGGEISSDGGSPIIEKGVCWGISPLPTTSNFKTSDGTGLDSFISSLTNLALNTTYYVRAFATNALGTSYGNERSFTTLSTAIVSTNTVSNIAQYSVSSGGNVISDGGAPVTSRGVCWSTNSLPTINDNKTIDGSGLGTFTSSLTGLYENTTYYIRAYSTNSVGTNYGEEKSFTTLPGPEPVSDIDGNIYYTVQIGTQIWLRSNLKTTKFNNGDPIPNITDNTAWSALTTPGYASYDNNLSNSSTYGLLYNWYTAIDSRNVCPIGWHMPTESDWSTIISFLGGELVAGGKMKVTGTSLWKSPNSSATNSTAFSGLPGGFRDQSGTFFLITEYCPWWSATLAVTDYPWAYDLRYNSAKITVSSTNNKNRGFAIRCVKD